MTKQIDMKKLRVALRKIPTCRSTDERWQVESAAIAFASDKGVPVINDSLSPGQLNHGIRHGVMLCPACKGNGTIAVREDRSEYDRMKAQKEVMMKNEELRTIKKYLSQEIMDVLIGGNHLASALVTAKCFPSEQESYDQVLKDFGQPCADMWIAWKAIIKLRDYREAAPSPPTSEGGVMNTFYANATRYESAETALTGKQIKEIANASPGDQMFQDKFGDGPDIGVGDGEAVRIDEGIKHFYTAPAATMFG